MGYNKKVLSKAVSELGKAKAPAKPKDIITDPAGQWKYPGQKTRIPGNNITMQGVNYPVWGQPNVGKGSMMQPGQNYLFPGADYVDETPMAKKGGTLNSKKYSKSMSATNKLFAKNKLFQNKKSKIFDPNSKFQEGGQADGLYTHSGHNYKKIDGKWYMEPVKDSGKYKLIEQGDVKSRIAELEKNAKQPKVYLHQPKNAIMDRINSQPQMGQSFDFGFNQEHIPGKDSNGENIFEIFDATGISSWDDVYRSAQETGWRSPETGIEIFGAIPLLGKAKLLGKGSKDLGKAFATTARQKNNVKAVSNTLNALGKFGPATGRGIDAVQAYKEFKSGGSKLGPINLDPNPLSHYELNYGFNLPTKQDGGVRGNPWLYTYNQESEDRAPGQVIGLGADFQHKSGLHGSTNVELPFFNKNATGNLYSELGYGKRFKNFDADATLKNYTEPGSKFNPSFTTGIGYNKNLGDHVGFGAGVNNTMVPGKLKNLGLQAGITYSFQEGGENENEYMDLTDEEIQAYRDGGYVVEELPEAQDGGPLKKNSQLTLDDYLKVYESSLQLEKALKDNIEYKLSKEIKLDPSKVNWRRDLDRAYTWYEGDNNPNDAGFKALLEMKDYPEDMKKALIESGKRYKPDVYYKKVSPYSFYQKEISNGYINEDFPSAYYDSRIAPTVQHIYDRDESTGKHADRVQLYRYDAPTVQEEALKKFPGSESRFKEFDMQYSTQPESDNNINTLALKPIQQIKTGITDQNIVISKPYEQEYKPRYGSLAGDENLGLSRNATQNEIEAARRDKARMEWQRKTQEYQQQQRGVKQPVSQIRKEGGALDIYQKKGEVKTFKRDIRDQDALSNTGWSSAPVEKKKVQPTVKQKQAQKSFDKDFKVTDKSKYEKTEDKIAEAQKAYVDWTKETGRTFTDADLKDIADRQWSFAGVGPQKQPDMMQATPEQSNSSRAWEYITNPMTAAEYAISGGGAENMPHNINEMRMVGIDPGVVQGRNLVGNTLNSSLNLFDAGDKVVRNLSRGNYGSAALEALRFAPGSGLLDDAVKLGIKPGAKYLAKNFNKSKFLDDVPSIPQQTFKKEVVSTYNPETKLYDLHEIDVPQEVIPGRSYADVQHKMKNLRKDLGINPIEHFIKKKIGSNKSIGLEKDAGMVINPKTGQLFDSNTRYWLNREYGITPKPGVNKTYLADNYGRLIKEGLPYEEAQKQLAFSKYLTQEEAVAARGERLISQKNKPGWDEQLTPEIEERLSTAVERHNPASNYPGERIGANTMGRTATEISKDANLKGVPLTDANKARVAAHEVGHYYSNSPAEGKEWVSHFDFSKLPQKTRDYLMGKGWKARNTDYANEVRERAAQLKDYIAQKNGIPLNQDFTITESMLDDAITNYIKDTGLDNTMSKMLGALTDKKGLLKTMNKYALGTIPAVIGAGALQQEKNGGSTESWEDELDDNQIERLRRAGYTVDELDEVEDVDTYQTGGPTVSQLWKEHTGTDWSEAHRQGLTSGSYADNMKLRDRILNSEFDNITPGNNIQQNRVKSQNHRDAYVKNVQNLINNNKSLDDLVSMRMGTREGLLNLFPNLGSAKAPVNKPVANTVLPVNNKPVSKPAVKVDRRMAATSSPNSKLPQLKVFDKQVKTVKPKVKEVRSVNINKSATSSPESFNLDKYRTLTDIQQRFADAKKYNVANKIKQKEKVLKKEDKSVQWQMPQLGINAPTPKAKYPTNINNAASNFNTKNKNQKVLPSKKLKEVDRGIMATYINPIVKEVSSPINSALNTLYDVGESIGEKTESTLGKVGELYESYKKEGLINALTQAKNSQKDPEVYKTVIKPKAKIVKPIPQAKEEAFDNDRLAENYQNITDAGDYTINTFSKKLSGVPLGVRNREDERDIKGKAIAYTYAPFKTYNEHLGNSYGGISLKPNSVETDNQPVIVYDNDKMYIDTFKNQKNTGKLISPTYKTDSVTDLVIDKSNRYSSNIEQKMIKLKTTRGDKDIPIGTADSSEGSFKDWSGGHLMLENPKTKEVVVIHGKSYELQKMFRKFLQENKLKSANIIETDHKAYSLIKNPKNNILTGEFNRARDNANTKSSGSGNFIYSKI